MSSYPSSSTVLRGVVAQVVNPGVLTPGQSRSAANPGPGGLTPGVLALTSRVKVTVTDVPGYGTLTLEADSNWTLDDVKRVLARVIATNEVHIPLGDWGFHALTRCTPYNMPVSHLRREDMPLRFCWHEWTDSWRHSQQR
ncbi:unnamed protein product [Symbiodinium sp. CCMP2592]|nr:unnamed protein product [Symbiodinium sp. CCMP2592]